MKLNFKNFKPWFTVEWRKITKDCFMMIDNWLEKRQRNDGHKIFVLLTLINLHYYMNMTPCYRWRVRVKKNKMKHNILLLIKQLKIYLCMSLRKSSNLQIVIFWFKPHFNSRDVVFTKSSVVLDLKKIRATIIQLKTPEYNLKYDSTPTKIWI